MKASITRPFFQTVTLLFTSYVVILVILAILLN